MRVGYIGLGNMGLPCAHNLLKANFEVFVWGRRAEQAKTLVEAGATWCESAEDLGSRIDILFTNLPNAVNVSSVLFGEAGALKRAGKGLIVVDMSTLSAVAVRDIAVQASEYGAHFVDAPVSGGVIGAVKGTLTILVGAEQSIFDRIKPVLAAMGSIITRMGDVGSGQLAKSCNQIMVTGMIIAVAEAMKFANSAGLDPAVVREALLTGSAAGNVLDRHGKRMVEDNYIPGFKCKLHLKDVEIVDEVARHLGITLSLTDTGRSIVREAVAKGYGEDDCAIVSKVV